MSESDSGFVDFKTIKRSVSMLQVLEHYGLTHTLKRNGDSLSGPCPLHGGQSEGQFKVSISKNCWHCFGKCKAGGNVLDFVSQKEKIGIREAAIFLMERVGLSTVPAKNKQTEEKKVKSPEGQKDNEEPVTTAEEPKINKPLGFVLKHLDPDHPYLTERGISQETVMAFGLGYCKKGILAGRIAIPIHNVDGELVAYIGRWPGIVPEGKEKYKFPENFKKAFEVFNVHRAVKESPMEPLIVVQSIFDCMKIWQTGLRRIVSIIGNTLSEEQSTLLLQAVSSQGRIALMFNNDEPAQSGCQNALMRLSPACYVRTIKLSPNELQPENLSQKKFAELLK